MKINRTSTMNQRVFLFIFRFLQAFAAIEAVRPSRGCKRKRVAKGYVPGETTVLNRKVRGAQRRKHRVTLPPNYTPRAETPPPLMFYFHGWGGNSNNCDDCDQAASERGFLTVSMTGYGKYKDCFYNVLEKIS